MDAIYESDDPELHVVHGLEIVVFKK